MRLFAGALCRRDWPHTVAGMVARPRPPDGHPPNIVEALPETGGRGGMVEPTDCPIISCCPGVKFYILSEMHFKNQGNRRLSRCGKATPTRRRTIREGVTLGICLRLALNPVRLSSQRRRYAPAPMEPRPQPDPNCPFQLLRLKCKILGDYIARERQQLLQSKATQPKSHKHKATGFGSPARASVAATQRALDASSRVVYPDG